MKIKLVKSENMDDWYTIERAEHDGRVWLEKVSEGASRLMDSARISDACVKGSAAEMQAIARAIRKREGVSFKRCAVDVLATGRVKFWSPRNSQEPGFTTLAEADELAAQIETTFAPKEWRIEGELDDLRIVMDSDDEKACDGERQIAHVKCSDYEYVDYDEHLAYAKRIVACVKACEKIKDPVTTLGRLPAILAEIEDAASFAGIAEKHERQRVGSALFHLRAIIKELKGE